MMRTVTLRRRALVVGAVVALGLGVAGGVAVAAGSSQDITCTITESTLSCPLPQATPVTATATQTVTAPPVTSTTTVTQAPVTTTVTTTATVTASPSPTTTTAPALTPPVAGYGNLVHNSDFGYAKTGPNAVTDGLSLWAKWRNAVFWQAAADPNQVAVQPGWLDLTMTAKNGTFKSVYIESKQTLDPAKSYYVESRLKTSGVKNVVPAFWLYANSPDVSANRNGSEGWQSEIDVMEQFNPSFGDNTKSFFTTHHTPNHQNISQYITTTTDLSTNWHTVGVEVQPTRVRAYMDGRPVSAWFNYVWSTASTPNAPAALILDLESASTLGVGSATTALPNTMSIDFVRIWSAP